MTPRSSKVSVIAGAPRPARAVAVVAAIAAGSLVATACGSSTSRSGSTAPTSSALPAKAGIVVTAANTKIGAVLTDPSGKTLYSFSADHGSNIGCATSACVGVWPPLVAPSGTSLTAGSGVTGKLGTLTRPDGQTQVTYNGLALYTFTGDSGPGQLNGQGLVEQYGAIKGTWTAVQPTSTAPATATPASTPAATTPTTAASVITQPPAQAPTPTRPPATAPATTRAPATTQPPATSPPTTSPPTPTTVHTWG